MPKPDIREGLEVHALGEFRVERRGGENGGDGSSVITGYASVFNTVADIGWFREQVAPGAFADTIAQGDDVRALIDHDQSRILGRSKAGTLRLSEDSKGLKVEIDLPDTQVARDLVVSMERGDVNQMSIGFYSEVEEWDETDPDNPLRTIKKARLFDVSVVTFPAFEQTEAQVRCREQRFDKHRKTTNFSNAARRLRMKANQDARARGMRTA